MQRERNDTSDSDDVYCMRLSGIPDAYDFSFVAVFFKDARPIQNNVLWSPSYEIVESENLNGLELRTLTRLEIANVADLSRNEIDFLSINEYIFNSYSG